MGSPPVPFRHGTLEVVHRFHAEVVVVRQRSVLTGRIVDGVVFVRKLCLAAIVLSRLEEESAIRTRSVIV